MNLICIIYLKNFKIIIKKFSFFQNYEVLQAFQVFTTVKMLNVCHILDKVSLVKKLNLNI